MTKLYFDRWPSVCTVEEKYTSFLYLLVGHKVQSHCFIHFMVIVVEINLHLPVSLVKVMGFTVVNSHVDTLSCANSQISGCFPILSNLVFTPKSRRLLVKLEGKPVLSLLRPLNLLMFLVALMLSGWNNNSVRD